MKDKILIDSETWKSVIEILKDTGNYFLAEEHESLLAHID